MANQDRAMYELMYVVNTVLNDDQIRDIVERVTAYIRENGGDVVEVDTWGSQRLAYPIQKKRNGYYVVTYFRAAGDLIARLDRTLRINDDVLRYFVLRYDGKMERHYEKQRSQRAQQAAAEPAAEA